MALTYKLTGNGYIILNNGKPWIIQESHIPFPANTIDESAQIHIKKLIEESSKSQTTTPEDEISELKKQVEALEKALNDLLNK